MKRWMQRNMVALVVAGALSLGLVGPAAAQVNVGDGLVNVQVGDIILLQDVNIGIAALVVATICDVQVGPINVLARSVDRTGVASAPQCDVSDGTNPDYSPTRKIDQSEHV